MGCRGKGFNCPTCNKKQTCDESAWVLQPVGITPKDIWLKKRKQEILDAIIRYTEAEIMIPMEWAKELRELEERGV